MRHISWATVIGGIVAATVLGCGGGERPPSSPSRLTPSDVAVRPDPAIGGTTVIAWSCAALGGEREGDTSIGGWLITRSPCPAATAGSFNSPAVVTGEPVFAPGPTNLRALVSGTTVQLNWDQPPTAAAWQIEAGSSPGLANLAVLRVGSNTLTVTGVPAGTYFVRVRSAPPNFSDLSVPSNEIIVTVGGCNGPPGPPAGFSAAVAGANVVLTWNASAGSPISYLLEVGSSAGLTDLLTLDTGSAATALSAVAPPGRYFARLRGTNGCGSSAPSNEIVVVVGSSPSTSTTSIRTTTTTVPGGTTSTSTTSTTIPGGTTSSSSSSSSSTTTSAGSSSSTTSTVLPAPPSAQFTLPASCQTELSCGAFNASSSTGTGLMFSWNFGDGQTGTGPMVSHTYADDSNLPPNTQTQVTVQLTVIDSFKRTSSVSHVFTLIQRY